MLTSSGKTIEEMNYAELSQELQLQRYIAKILHRTQWAQAWACEQRAKDLENDTRVEDARAKYERGEITEKEFKLAERGYKQSVTKLKLHEAKLDFSINYEWHVRAFMESIQEEMTHKPKRKPKDKHRVNHNLRKGDRLKKTLRQKKKESQSGNRHTNFIRWEQSLRKDGLSILWDKDRFMAICKDRGYLNIHAVKRMLRKLTSLSDMQVVSLLDSGRFTWGQVLVIGAELKMTPKEFADTFMNGYFTEVADGYFEASYDNITEGALDYPQVPSRDPVSKSDNEADI